jgi:7-cyano-7-deazaguanine synthase in queuosine biosynthesis
MNTLINISGGVDSIFTAWKLLSENSNETFLLHHVSGSQSFLPANSRVKLEKSAVLNFLQYLDNHNITNYKYIESKRYRTDSSVKSIKDIEMVGIFTGILLRTYTTISKIVVSANLEDLEQGVNYNERSQTRFEIINAISRNHNVEYIYPIKDLTKSEISNLMPEELLKLCWYCRNPQIGGKVCGKCQPCININK